MTTKDKIIIVLDRQSNNSTVTQIAKELEMTVPKLKEFMKSEGYSYDNGKFMKGVENKPSDEEQLSLGGVDVTTTKTKGKRKSKEKEVEITPEEVNTEEELIEVDVTTMDKLCFMTDLYNAIKDDKKLRPKPTKKTTQVYIEDNLIEESKRITIKIDENISNRLERLVANTNQERDLIINQALLDLLNEYKHLN